jgi:hypothetical protein
MNTGQRLGLVLLYVVLAGYAVLMVRIFVQVLFKPAIEKHRRRQFTEKNGGAAYTPRAFVEKTRLGQHMDAEKSFQEPGIQTARSRSFPPSRSL